MGNGELVPIVTAGRSRKACGTDPPKAQPLPEKYGELERWGDKFCLLPIDKLPT
jgi:hypothetical protein